MPTPAAEPLQDETRRRLIEAGGEVFAGRGYHAATVREICARAHVNVAAVNYHFGDKLALYTEILKNATLKDEPLPVARETLASAPPEEALRLFLHGMFHRMFQADRPGWHTRVMAHELAQPTPALAAVVEH